MLVLERKNDQGVLIRISREAIEQWLAEGEARMDIEVQVSTRKNGIRLGITAPRIARIIRRELVTISNPPKPLPPPAVIPGE